MTGRVIIDIFGFIRQFPATQISVLPLTQHERNARLCVEGETSSGSPALSAEPDFLENGERPTAVQQDKNKNELSTQEKYLLLLTPMLPGYSLKLKKWSKVPTSVIIRPTHYLPVLFHVDHIQNISWNTTAFDHLILSENIKDLISVLVDRHNSSAIGNEEVIKGKGMRSLSLVV